MSNGEAKHPRESSGDRPVGASGVFSKVILLLCSLAAAFAFAEAVLRIWPPGFYSDPSRQYHPDLGWIAQPGKVFYRQRGDGLVRFETNSIGFRDREHSFQQSLPMSGQGSRPIRRIVVIGDSFSESAQVELHLTFWSKLKDKLNLGQEVYWEVVNLGTSGYGTLQEQLALERFGMDFQPDLIILQIFPLNDIVNNSVAAANVTYSQDAYRPYLNPRTGYRTITYLNPKTSWLRRRSAVFRNAFLVVQKYFGPWGDEKIFPDRESRMAYLETLNAELGLPAVLGTISQPIMINTFAPEEHQLSMIREGWAATEAAIDRIQETVEAGGSRLVVMVVPDALQLKHRFQRRTKNLPYPADPDYAGARLRRHVGERAAAFVDLLGPFEANMRLVLPYMDGHFNSATHELVADLLAAEIVRLFPERFDEEIAARFREKTERRRQGPPRPQQKTP